MDQHSPDSDFETIGRRVRDRRKQFGLSTAELAEMAGVARYTLVRLEQGLPCKRPTIIKILRALHMFTDQVIRPYEEGPFAVHRSSETQWSVSHRKSKYQKLLEGDDPIHVDDAAERRRLGILGFQPFFTAILAGSELAGGVTSHALMEFHQPSWTDTHYGEEFVYCLQGSITITVDGVPCCLETGDSMTFDGTLPHQYSPTRELAPEDPPVVILIVVALRPGEKRPKPEPGS